MKRIILSLAMIASTLAFAETTTTTAPGSAATSTVDSSSILEKLKASPFSLNLYTDNYTNTEKRNGFTSENYVNVKYKIDKYHSIKVSPIIVIDNTPQYKDGNGAKTTYLQTDVNLYRSQILTEEKNGVALSAGLYNSIYKNTNYFENSGGKASRHGLNGTFSKTFGKNSFSLGQSIYVYNRNSGQDNISQSYFSTSFAYSYSFNDYVSAGVYNLWYSYDAATKYSSGYSTSESFRTIPSVDFSYGDLAASLYLDATPLRSHDGLTGTAANWLKKSYLGVTVSYNVF